MKLSNYKWMWCIIIVIGLFFAADSAEAATANLTIRHQDTVIFSGSVDAGVPTEFSFISGNNTATTTAPVDTVLSALVNADSTSESFDLSDISYFSSFNDYIINCLTITNPTVATPCYNWKYVVNGQYPSVGIGNFALTGGEDITLYFGDRYQISTEKNEYTVSEMVTTTLEEYNYATNVWSGLPNSEVLATEPILPDFSNWPPTTITSSTTGENGIATLSFTSAGSYYVTIPNDYYPGVTITVTSAPAPIPEENSIRLIVRHEDRFVYDDIVILTPTTTITFHPSTDTVTTTATLTTSTVLSALATADDLSESFSLSDLSFFSSFNSYYVRCLTFVTSTACDNWNYVVNGQYATIGMDSFHLEGGETVYVYFDNPWQITASTSTPVLGVTTTFTTWRYQYDNLDEPWTADPNDLVEISIPNPNPPFPWETTLAVTTTLSDATGIASYVFTTTGTFFAKITSLDFTKWSIPITLTVSEPQEETPPPPSSGGNGGGNTIPPTPSRFDIPLARAFLTTHQTADGLIGDGLITDWAAIAFAGVPSTDTTVSLLRTYLLSDPTALITGNPTTDYARRAMALLALGINPYTGTKTNYIERLINQFDAPTNQFGNPSLVNDDMFALITLLHAGYTVQDSIIASTTQFIINTQATNGSWFGPDLTGAAIQALTPVSGLPGAVESLTKAKNYLHTIQQTNGSFDNNISATSWVMQAIGAVGENESVWTKNATPSNYLTLSQTTDGGVELQAPLSQRIWSTSYAIPAAAYNSWHALLSSVTKPQTPTPPSVGNNSSNDSQSGVGGPGPGIVTSTSEIMTATSTSTTTKTIELSPGHQSEEQTTQPILPIAVSSPLSSGAVTPEASPSEPETLYASTLSEIPPSSGDILTARTASTTPIRHTAQNVFIGASSLAGTLGLYLVWRFAQTLI